MFDNPTGAKLTRKQKIFVKEYIDNKGNGTQAALKAYGKPDKQLKPKTAQSIATENLSKPVIVMALGSYNDMIESKMIKTIEQWGESDRPREREIAVDLMKYSHDKIHGKASQSIQVSQTHVNISLDLTGGDVSPIPREVLEQLED